MPAAAVAATRLSPLLLAMRLASLHVLLPVLQHETQLAPPHELPHVLLHMLPQPVSITYHSWFEELGIAWTGWFQRA